MKVRTFLGNERGIALTEYLLLFGLLSSGVVIGIFLFGAQLGLNYSGWSSYLDHLGPADVSGPTIAAAPVAVTDDPAPVVDEPDPTAPPQEENDSDPGVVPADDTCRNATGVANGGAECNDGTKGNSNKKKP